MKNHGQLKRVIIMAGGTGGHVFPGLALANYLRDKGIEVHWLGTKAGLEAKVIPQANIPLHLINISGLRGKGIKTLLLAPFKISSAIWQAVSVIRKLRPDVVIGMGGFVSGPGGFASWLLRYPLVIHEQNAKAGLTNKILAHFASRVLEGFPGAFYTKEHVFAVGNPVRPEIEGILPPESRLQTERRPYRLLVLGGSLGAQALNEIVPRALQKLASDNRPMVYHQTGDKHFMHAKKEYESLGIEAKLEPFIQDMSQAYAWADIVICRAGALTVTELCSAGLGAIFVPYPHAVDDHQTANASYMVKHNAALCIQQKALSADSLANQLQDFFEVPEKCLAMAKAAYGLRKTHVTEKIFDILSSVVN